MILGSSPIETRDGIFWATYSPHGLCSLDFPNGTQRAFLEVAAPPDWHMLTENGVRAVLAGEALHQLPPFDLRSHTAFRQAVWRELQTIPFGTTVTYGQLAERLGLKAGARAVGGACGSNPIPLLIPCHRVVAHGNRLGGFSGGLDWKIRLLEREGALANLSDPFTCSAI